MEVPFTQFLMPDGRRTQVTIERPDEICEQAQKLLEAGWRLEIEMLATSAISMTVERDVDGDDDEIVCSAHEICNNGPAVPIAVDKLITEATAWVDGQAPTVTVPSAKAEAIVDALDMAQQIVPNGQWGQTCQT